MDKVANPEKEITCNDDIAMGTFTGSCEGMTCPGHEKTHIPYNERLPFTVAGMYDRTTGNINDLHKIVTMQAMIIGAAKMRV